MIERLTATMLVLGLSLAAPAMAGLFDEDGVLELRLEGPIETLVDQKRYPAVRPFQLKVDGQSIPVGVRVRGKSRLEICDFPPLSVNFGEAGAPAGSVFAGLRSLKLVTHCLDYGSGELNVLSEYSVYRIQGLLTDFAYRARLLLMTYADTAGGRERQHYAFALEPQADLATRLGGERVKVPQVSLQRFDADQLALVYVFQYLVGNTDWSLVTAHGDTSCCHNGDLVEVAGKWRYVAYDFDMTGLVNARYARPNPALGTSKVTQRVYRGFCNDPQVLAGALAKVTARQADILGVIDTLPLLEAKQRADRRDYLGQFFEKAGKPDKLLKDFNRRCLKP